MNLAHSATTQPFSLDHGIGLKASCDPSIGYNKEEMCINKEANKRETRIAAFCYEFKHIFFQQLLVLSVRPYLIHQSLISKII